MSKADKAVLEKGALAIRKAEAGAKGKLDGTLASVVKEITRLHGEIMSAARTTLEKAIRIGELLTRVKASRKGKWLAWIEGHAPFSHDTAKRYMTCYANRNDPRLRNVRNLSDAYGLLTAPKIASSNGQPDKAHKGSRMLTGTEIAPEPARVPLRDLRRPARNTEIVKPGDLHDSQVEIDAELRSRLAQIRQQAIAEWPDFPVKLIAHGKALIEQGERLAI